VSAPSKIIPIHTSDIGLYKTCRRRWLWGSHLNRSLEPVNKAAPLWFGEAIHYALKDYHGYGTDIIASFLTYAQLSKEKYPDRLPDEFPELLELGKGMLDHYMSYLERRNPLTTYVHNGVPQVEVAFEIELPIDPALLEVLGIAKVVYRGTMDRVVIDEEFQVLDIVDYKTAARMEQGHLMMDPQISKYMWAASCIYDLPVQGFWYQQHAKRIPKAARVLLNGHVSTAKNQATTHKLYRQALVEVYGSPQQSSNKHIEVLNAFGAKETRESDGYIVRTKTTRNAHQIANEGARILLEVHEMLDPRTPMYIHASQHCSWCPFISPCTSLEDGGDYEYELRDSDLYVTRNKASSEWEIIAHDGLGGILHQAKANIAHDPTRKLTTAADYSQANTFGSLGSNDPSQLLFGLADRLVGVEAESDSGSSTTERDPIYQPGRHKRKRRITVSSPTDITTADDPGQAFLDEYFGPGDSH
jgi:hypothetical protein